MGWLYGCVAAGANNVSIVDQLCFANASAPAAPTCWQPVLGLTDFGLTIVPTTLNGGGAFFMHFTDSAVVCLVPVDQACINLKGPVRAPAAKLQIVLCRSALLCKQLQGASTCLLAGCVWDRGWGRNRSQGPRCKLCSCVWCCCSLPAAMHACYAVRFTQCGALAHQHTRPAQEHRLFLDWQCSFL